MDLSPINTTHPLDTDTQTPPPTHSSKSSPFTNGSLKLHHPTTTVPPPPHPPPSMVVYSYKECLKNHAAGIGGHALDGCGEFMSSSSSTISDPRSLTCAACGCHRNFHRRDPQDYSTLLPPQTHRGLSLSTSPSLSPSPSPSPLSSPSPPPLSHHFPPSYNYHSSAPHMLLALGNAYSGPSDRGQNRNFSFNSSVTAKTENNNPSGNKKRYRTKFSQEQKEKMHSFSEKLGWKLQKGDEELVQEFCKDIGVSRGVFKVWMHNNKNNFRKRSSETTGNVTPSDEKINGDNTGNGGGGRGGFDSDINNPYNTNSSNSDIHRNEGS